MTDGIGWQQEGMPDAGRIFAELRALSDRGQGVTRAAYTPSETAALELIARIAGQHCLEVERDAAANLVVSLPGQDATVPCILIGSHLDSVPQGGNYDGAAGVIAGLLCLIRLRMERRVLRQGVKLLALRGEESPWFETACLGSRALFGELGRDLARTHRDTGRTLREHLVEVGADLEAIIKGSRLLEPGKVAGYYELHIEQGPVMVERRVPIGIVSGIRGILRYPAIKCNGEEGHSGAVPRALRRDAILATADLLRRLEDHWVKLLGQSADLVVTSGMFSTPADSHSPSRIAGEVAFSLDVRSLDSQTLKNFDALVRDEMKALEGERKISFTIGTQYLTPPEKMDDFMRSHLVRTATRCKIPFIEMASGSGHDAIVFARNQVPSAMIFVRNQNGSHNPNESMEIEDFLQASELLYQALTEPIERRLK